MGYKIGNIIEGRVTGIQPYGAFISLDDQTQGLIHVSEVQSGYTKNIHNFLEVGQKVKVQIIDIDEYTKKISLSLRTLTEHPVETAYHRKRYFTNRNKNIGFRSLEKNMPIWISEAIDYLLKESNEK
ncbi:CvfD/Ygs/GSP13 family RNA-binding post-transcriptional regulator [Enterococcus devriesei]|uniref:General stress protein n=1 Tax=Enterococcus devriesei TaxID=319970 RepID=A0A1L8SMQ1_9ENTE|nr:CvfD/Ygs/GSP13 family RNA-binding post-transcriptional regulator [Enterococcus devriesei]MBU5366709.1 S1 RNA-binding domain-containing protein [Enterococcus devriesei]MDT2820967.1 CvfD/Ygs/GSP13 family RNA-binding post-transcriptional regulator [Enterococcus devriesei]MDU6525027.1 CvfD/Ygs/GSP13 family RNA-binding post-transcriptional regulator [Enterococcus sp.]OJG33359.1 general stress protein [Enterococcus devriesei]